MLFVMPFDSDTPFWSGMQILIDISTPRSFFDRIEVKVREHVKASPLDFSGDCAISCDKNAGNEPLKIVLVVWWSYAFNGEASLACKWSQPSSDMLQDLRICLMESACSRIRDSFRLLDDLCVHGMH